MDRIIIWCTVYEGSDKSEDGYEHYYDLYMSAEEYEAFKNIVIEKIDSGEAVYP